MTEYKIVFQRIKHYGDPAFPGFAHIDDPKPFIIQEFIVDKEFHDTVLKLVEYMMKERSK